MTGLRLFVLAMRAYGDDPSYTLYVCSFFLMRCLFRVSFWIVLAWSAVKLAGSDRVANGLAVLLLLSLTVDALRVLVSAVDDVRWLRLAARSDAASPRGWA